jgi:TATA-box binding protein (TBP) (component of TFIID and TFIIIB)
MVKTKIVYHTKGATAAKSKTQSKTQSKTKTKSKTKSKTNAKSSATKKLVTTATPVVKKTSNTVLKEIIYDPSVTNVDTKVIQSYETAKKFMNDVGIKISTITLDCKLGVLINVERFARHVVLEQAGVLSVKFGPPEDKKTNRSIIVLKAKKKPSKVNFQNQVTIRMRPQNNLTRNPINIKVFKNGSLQMTGCKDMEDFHNVTNNLINILKKGQKIKRDGKKLKLKFIENNTTIAIFDTKIRMINSNFKVGYKIDRKKLAKILRSKHSHNSKNKQFGYIECKYEPTSGHSCVNIKHHYDDKHKSSIFVFQTGAIIITGAKNYSHIIAAYNFIMKLLEYYYSDVKIIDLDLQEVTSAMVQYFRSNGSKDKKPAVVLPSQLY